MNIKLLTHRFPIRHLLLLPALLLAGTANLYADAPILIENAWIAEAPPVSKVMAGYMDIHNPGDQKLEITRITSADFSSIEIHRTVHEDGMARMLRQSSIELAAGGHFELKPGSYHLMMFNPAKTLRAGDHSELIFTLANGTTTSLTVPVKKATGYADNGHH